MDGVAARNPSDTSVVLDNCSPESIIAGLLSFLDLTDPDKVLPRWALILVLTLASIYFLMGIAHLVVWIASKVRD